MSRDCRREGVEATNTNPQIASNTANDNGKERGCRFEDSGSEMERLNLTDEISFVELYGNVFAGKC